MQAGSLDAASPFLSTTLDGGGINSNHSRTTAAEKEQKALVRKTKEKEKEKTKEKEKERTKGKEKVRIRAKVKVR